MKSSSPPLDAVPGVRMPLRIIVSRAGQHAALDALASQYVPMLQNPEAFTLERRIELAHRLARAIQPRGDIQERDATGLDSEPNSVDDPFRWVEDVP